MDFLFPALLVGISTFAVTNVDDLVLLSLYFSQAATPQKRRAIVAGQYLGITALVALSLVASLSALIIPEEYIGLLGILPILLGIKQFFAAESSEEEVLPAAPPSGGFRQILAGFLHPNIYGVTAVTLANGSDNVAIYTPLFASAGISHLLVILVVFVGMVAVWCFAAYKLVQQPLVLRVLQRWGHQLMPFVMIGLGLSIMLESGTFSLIS
jgi:cadmium resistance transport/sequestration family protein